MSFIQIFGGHRLPPFERLLWAMLLQAFYAIRSERQLMERLEFDLLFRLFIASEFMVRYEIIPSSLRIPIMGAALAVNYEHGTRGKSANQFLHSTLRRVTTLR